MILQVIVAIGAMMILILCYLVARTLYARFLITTRIALKGREILISMDSRSNSQLAPGPGTLVWSTGLILFLRVITMNLLLLGLYGKIGRILFACLTHWSIEMTINNNVKISKKENTILIVISGITATHLKLRSCNIIVQPLSRVILVSVDELSLYHLNDQPKIVPTVKQRSRESLMQSLFLWSINEKFIRITRACSDWDLTCTANKITLGRDTSVYSVKVEAETKNDAYALYLNIGSILINKYPFALKIIRVDTKVLGIIWNDSLPQAVHCDCTSIQILDQETPVLAATLVSLMMKDKVNLFEYSIEIGFKSIDIPSQNAFNDLIIAIPRFIRSSNPSSTADDPEWLYHPRIVIRNPVRNLLDLEDFPDRMINLLWESKTDVKIHQIDIPDSLNVKHFNFAYGNALITFGYLSLTANDFKYKFLTLNSNTKKLVGSYDLEDHHAEASISDEAHFRLNNVEITTMDHSITVRNRTIEHSAAKMQVETPTFSSLYEFWPENQRSTQESKESGGSSHWSIKARITRLEINFGTYDAAIDMMTSDCTTESISLTASLGVLNCDNKYTLLRGTDINYTNGCWTCNKLTARVDFESISNRISRIQPSISDSLGDGDLVRSSVIPTTAFNALEPTELIKEPSSVHELGRSSESASDHTDDGYGKLALFSPWLLKIWRYFAKSSWHANEFSLYVMNGFISKQNHTHALGITFLDGLSVALSKPDSLSICSKINLEYYSTPNTNLRQLEYSGNQIIIKIIDLPSYETGSGAASIWTPNNGIKLSDFNLRYEIKNPIDHYIEIDTPEITLALYDEHFNFWNSAFCRAKSPHDRSNHKLRVQSYIATAKKLLQTCSDELPNIRVSLASPISIFYTLLNRDGTSKYEVSVRKLAIAHTINEWYELIVPCIEVSTEGTSMKISSMRCSYKKSTASLSLSLSEFAVSHNADNNLVDEPVSEEMDTSAPTTEGFVNEPSANEQDLETALLNRRCILQNNLETSVLLYYKDWFRIIWPNSNRELQISEHYPKLAHDNLPLSRLLCNIGEYHHHHNMVAVAEFSLKAKTAYDYPRITINPASSISSTVADKIPPTLPILTLLPQHYLTNPFDIMRNRLSNIVAGASTPQHRIEAKPAQSDEYMFEIVNNCEIMTNIDVASEINQTETAYNTPPGGKTHSLRIGQKLVLPISELCITNIRINPDENIPYYVYGSNLSIFVKVTGNMISINIADFTKIKFGPNIRDKDLFIIDGMKLMHDTNIDRGLNFNSLKLVERDGCSSTSIDNIDLRGRTTDIPYVLILYRNVNNTHEPHVPMSISLERSELYETLIIDRFESEYKMVSCCELNASMFKTEPNLHVIYNEMATPIYLVSKDMIPIMVRKYAVLSDNVFNPSEFEVLDNLRNTLGKITTSHSVLSRTRLCDKYVLYTYGRASTIIGIRECYLSPLKHDESLSRYESCGMSKADSPHGSCKGKEEEFAQALDMATCVNIAISERDRDERESLLPIRQFSITVNHATLENSVTLTHITARVVTSYKPNIQCSAAFVRRSGLINSNILNKLSQSMLDALHYRPRTVPAHTDTLYHSVYLMVQRVESCGLIRLNDESFRLATNLTVERVIPSMQFVTVTDTSILLPTLITLDSSVFSFLRPGSMPSVDRMPTQESTVILFNALKITGTRIKVSLGRLLSKISPSPSFEILPLQVNHLSDMGALTRLFYTHVITCIGNEIFKFVRNIINVPTYDSLKDLILYKLEV